MASQMRYTAGSDDVPRGVAAGVISFAAIIMIFAGGFQALVGLSALAGNDIYAETPNYVFQLDLTTWGWVHLIVGGVVFVAGFGIVLGQTWARVVGIILAVVSAIATFAFIPYYPFWALVIIALDVMVVWALATHGTAAAGPDTY